MNSPCALPPHNLLSAGRPSSPQEMRSNRRSTGCQHLLLGLAAHVLSEAPPVRLVDDCFVGGVGHLCYGCWLSMLG